MWTNIGSISQPQDDETKLRIDLRNDAGHALQSILSWLTTQAQAEVTWKGVPWWAKRSIVELDWLIGVLSKRPGEGYIYRVEAIAGIIESSSRGLHNGPDLSSLRRSLNTYADYRRKNG